MIFATDVQVNIAVAKTKPAIVLVIPIIVLKIKMEKQNVYHMLKVVVAMILGLMVWYVEKLHSGK